MAEVKSRRRGERLEQAILDAAWAELSDRGYADLTIEGVAARARTSKPVIYRRWPNRAALVVAAWSRQAPGRATTPDTGTLRGDLVALFTRVAQRADTVMSETIAGVMSEAFHDPEVIALLTERLRSAPLSAPVTRIVERAVARGELAPVTLTARAARLPLDLVRAESMLCRPVSPAVVDELVDEVYLPVLRGLAGR